MKKPIEIHVCSELQATVEDVWRHATSPAGVNRELMPLARMTFPSSVASLGPESVTLGERVCRSWVLLFGVLPVDYDDVTLVELGPGARFLERSPMLSQRFWEHERTVDACAKGARICDRVRFFPRAGALAPAYHAIYRATFALRHRNLRRIFGGVPSRP